MIAKIEFDDNYSKLYNQRQAKLLAVETKFFTFDKNHCPCDEKEFLNYDTENYNYKHGNYDLLIFLGWKNIPFTTIRKLTAEEKDYYNRLIGFTFDIVVKNKEATDEL